MSGATRRRTLTVALLTLVCVAACSDDTGGDTAAPDPTSSTVGTTSVPASTTTVATTTSTTTTTTVPLVDRRLPVAVQRPADLPGHNVYTPSDPAAVGHPLPVVVWGNGGCFRHDATWRPLFERWAASGFIVVTVAAPDEPVEGEPAATDPHSADDQAAGIDWALDENNRSGGPFEGRVDVDRVVAAGNSCGGITALELAARDRRVAAVFVLSGSSVPPGASFEAAAEVMGEISVPVGYAVGGPEDLASAMAAQDLDALSDGVAGLIAARSSADHVVVSTDPEILDDVAEIALNWLDLALYGGDAAREAIAGVACGGCEPGLWTITARHLDTLPSL